MIDIRRRMAWFIPVPKDPRAVKPCERKMSMRRECAVGTYGCIRHHGPVDLLWIEADPDSIHDHRLRVLMGLDR